jgi:hypothetical protein
MITIIATLFTVCCAMKTMSNTSNACEKMRTLERSQICQAHTLIPAAQRSRTRWTI